MVEHLAHNQTVAGSIPAPATKIMGQRLSERGVDHGADTPETVRWLAKPEGANGRRMERARRPSPAYRCPGVAQG